jgi:hypothetical protein
MTHGRWHRTAARDWAPVLVGVMVTALASPLAAQEVLRPGALAQAVAELTARPDLNTFVEGRAGAPTPVTEAPRFASLAPDTAVALTGTRVRITITVRPIEQMLLLIGASAAGGTPIESRDDKTVVVPLADGRRITLPGRSGFVIGDLAESTATSLTVKMDDGRSVTIPRALIVRHERLDGVSSRGRRALWGLLLGGTGGTLLGLLHGQGCVSQGAFSLGCLGEPAASAAAGLMLGGGGGAAVGALLPRGERWTVVSSH